METENATTVRARYVKAEQLRHLFSPPVSLRHIRDLQARRRIPYLKLGGGVWFDPDQVFTTLKTSEVQANG